MLCTNPCKTVLKTRNRTRCLQTKSRAIITSQMANPAAAHMANPCENFVSRSPGGIGGLFRSVLQNSHTNIIFWKSKIILILKYLHRQLFCTMHLKYITFIYLHKHRNYVTFYSLRTIFGVIVMDQYPNHCHSGQYFCWLAARFRIRKFHRIKKQAVFFVGCSVPTSMEKNFFWNK